MAGLKNLAADRRQGGDNVHAVDQPSSVKSRQFKLSWKDTLKFIFT